MLYLAKNVMSASLNGLPAAELQKRVMGARVGSGPRALANGPASTLPLAGPASCSLNSTLSHG